MCLVSRHLEANGIPTMCLGSGLDILKSGRPPRTTFLDYPLGHSAGKAFDEGDQYAVVRAALAALESAREPGAITMLPNLWTGDDGWKAEAGSSRGGDTRESRDGSPRFQLPADREAAVASGALVSPAA